MWCSLTHNIYLFTNGSRAQRQTFVREKHLSGCRHPNNLGFCKWSERSNLSRLPQLLTQSKVWAATETVQKTTNWLQSHFAFYSQSDQHCAAQLHNDEQRHYYQNIRYVGGESLISSVCTVKVTAWCCKPALPVWVRNTPTVQGTETWRPGCSLVLGTLVNICDDCCS